MLGVLAVAFEADDPARTAAFWGDLLGRTPVPDPDGVLLPGTPTQLGLLRTGRTTAPDGRRVHLHLGSRSIAERDATVARVLALGGAMRDVGQLPDEPHTVVEDVEHNEFCVIEPGNGWLAGCGLLGELACDGMRDLGLFWAEALGWPLVWDQDGETAVQAPEGGTKIAWGGAPIAAQVGDNPQHLVLTSSEPEDLERLVQLGARVVRTDGSGTTTLLDPEGNHFRVRAAG